jgi:galactose mutarotase-like enzyme
MNFDKIGEHSYKLTSNEETLEQFPYNFELYVNYKIIENKLVFNYKVINKTPNENMLFGIGGHPGFKCDYYEENYSVEFEEEENDIKIIPVDVDVCLLSDKMIDGNTVIKNKKILEIKKKSFVNDAIIFTDMKSKSVILKKNEEKILKFNFEQFKYLGIWSQVGDAPFVCFEPWYNTPDYINSTKEFKDKKDIIELDPETEFNISFSVEFF